MRPVLLSPLLVVVILTATVVSGSGSLLITSTGSIAGPSFNSHVSCQPVVMSIEKLIGSVVDSFGGADYSGGALPLVGPLPLNSNPTNWPYSKRATPPPCMVTLANGTVLPTLVELDNVLVVSSILQTDCVPGTTFCDYHITLSNPAYASSSCGSTNTTACMHRILVETDQAWYQLGWYSDQSSSAPVQGSTINIQGFVYWDPLHTSDSFHEFSGWELHPVIGWRPK